MFFNIDTFSGVHLFDHLLWPIFQSTIHILFIQFFPSSYMFMVIYCGQLSCTASTLVFFFSKLIVFYNLFYNFLIHKSICSYLRVCNKYNYSYDLHDNGARTVYTYIIHDIVFTMNIFVCSLI